MSATVFPNWVFVTVALMIALIAFGLAQVAPGAGTPFVAGAATLWVAYAAARQRRMKHHG